MAATNPYRDFVAGFARLLADGAEIGAVPDDAPPRAAAAGAPKALIFAPHPDDEVIVGDKDADRHEVSTARRACRPDSRPYYTLPRPGEASLTRKLMPCSARRAIRSSLHSSILAP